MLLLIVGIGTLNVALGFGLAMYCGYGPPGLDGVIHALGPMPPATPDRAPPGAVLAEAYVPVAPETASEAAENPLVGPPGGPAETLPEEGVLSELHEMTSAAQAALSPATAQAQG